MTADALLQFLTQALFFGLFVVVGIQAIRRPLRANVDIALLFGVLSLIVAEQWLANIAWAGEWLTADQWDGLSPWLSAAAGSLILAHPYLLLRLVDDFSTVPRWLMRFALAGFVLGAVSLLLSPATRPAWHTIVLVAYFTGLEIYAAAQFVREARRTSGVTSRRMLAAAGGSAFLGMVIPLALPNQLLPHLAPLWTLLIRTLGLASGLSYFLAFAPPGWLRRLWQEPELRAFLSRAADLPRLPDTASIIRALERGAATSLGAQDATIGLWDETHQALRFPIREPMRATLAGAIPSIEDPASPYSMTQGAFLVRPGHLPAGKAFASQQPVALVDAGREDPENASFYQALNISAVLAAPITAGTRRLGVLVVYAARAPIFADEDLVLVALLADQAAVILESRALIDEAARVKALEEATRLKEDFLSAAAHDLKTPLTTIVAQAQLLARRAQRNPGAGADLAGIGRIINESKRLSTLVHELLDASRAGRGQLVGERTTVDLTELAREICQRQPDGRCVLEANGPVIGSYDRGRVGQLLENLIENALKYSPEQQPVFVRVIDEASEAHLTVSDRGIGIPPDDLPRIFERFYRAGNVDDRRFAGMGLGLHICRAIAEQHGGRIWAESQPGKGSTFHVILPLAAKVAA